MYLQKDQSVALAVTTKETKVEKRKKKEEKLKGGMPFTGARSDF